MSEDLAASTTAHEHVADEPAMDLCRRQFLKRSAVGGLLTFTFGCSLATFKVPASADQPLDVQILQTAASIENLAVATYDLAATLPFIASPEANPFVRQFFLESRNDHQEHAAAINAAVSSLGGTPQLAVNPVLSEVVNQAQPGLVGSVQMIDLALQLEDAAAQTYISSTARLQNGTAKQVAASIMGVEAQHVAILNMVRTLLTANASQLVALPPNAAQLPGEAGSSGFPDTFYKTTMARSAEEGVVR